MIGGYCPGAMSMNRVTPGDPKHTFFIPEAGGGGIWGTFGSENGPIKWANMTSDERKQSTIVARENYRKRTGPDPGDKKVTVLR